MENKFQERSGLMTRRTLLSVGGASAVFRRTHAQRSARPNVVFFMTDDHGFWAMGAYGCPEMYTPNLDRLAAGGALFTRGYACTPVCSPSRATFYTGKLPSHHGVQDFLMADDSYGPKTRRFLQGHVTFSQALKDHGYACGMAGKWHLGDDLRAQAGFDHWYTALPGGGGGGYKAPEFLVNGKKVQAPDYKTDFVGDCAVRFIEENRNKSFCLVVPFYAPHTPFDYQPEKYRLPYKDSPFTCFPEPPRHPQRRGQFERYHGSQEAKTSYSALVTGVDHNVGRVIAKLDDLGLKENTVVVFSADQGWNAGHHGVWGKGNATIPFNMFEESTRVPLIWYHPGRIRSGQVVSAMVSSYDFFPTLLDYLGIDLPADPQRVGRSYAGFLRGESPTWQNELYFEYGYTRAIQTVNLKYIERSEGWPNELFDLEADPGETVNRVGAPEYREQVRQLRLRLHRFFDAAGAPLLENWRSTTRQIIPSDVGYYRWGERPQ